MEEAETIGEFNAKQPEVMTPVAEDKENVGPPLTVTSGDKEEGGEVDVDEANALRNKIVEALMSGQRENELEYVENKQGHGGWSSSGIALSKLLWRQIRSLQEKEREVEERLERQRVEQLVDKVENEIEYQSVVDEMCNAAESERLERELELERKEVRLEEQVQSLKERIRKLESDLSMAKSSTYKPEEVVDEAIQRLLAEGRVNEEDVSDEKSPGRSILVAFEDMLKEADERHEREKQALEETLRAKEEAEVNFRHERHRRRAREKQIESQMVAMHKEIGRLSSLLKEKEHGASVERERRQTSQEEAGRLAVLLKDEKVAHRLMVVKLKKLESFFSRLREKMAREMAETGKDSEFLRNLDKDIGRLSAIFNLKKELPKSEAEQFEAVRKQLEVSVNERDKAEEKINMLLKRSRDREAEIDAMWLERERLLIDKMTSLEEQAEQWELKCRRYEDDVAAEKSTWEQDASALKRACEDEKRALEAMVAERDAWMRDQDERMQSLLEAKDHELLMMKTVQQKLLNNLARYKTARRQKDEEAGDASCEGAAAEESDTQSAVDFETMASELGLELENRAKEMRVREETLEQARSELRVETEKLNTERKELEEKVCDTLSLMEKLKTEMEGKEKQMQWEVKEMETLVASKNDEIEALKRELDEKDLELEERGDKFQNEMQLIEQEIEKERREREKIMDSHFASKKMLATEVQLKEEFWEKDMNRMVQEITSLRAEVRKKTEDLESLSMEACVKESQFTMERERLLADQKEQEEEVSRLRLDVSGLVQELQTAQRNNSDSEFIGSESSAFESTEAKRNAEWQFALGKVAVFDKQISEAMQAIQNLREELSAKEAELQKARNEPELLEIERVEDQDAIYERDGRGWREKEQKNVMEKAELVKLLESERSEASDTIALLHGTIRELHWSLMRRGSKEMCESVKDLIMNSKRGDMVKVHASHLREVDQYICELKARVEDAEKSRSGALTEKRPTRDEELDEALLNVEKEMLRFSPDRRSRLTFPDDSPMSSTRTRCLERSLLATANDQPGTSSDRAWNLGGPLSCVAVKDTIENRWLPQEIPGQDPFALALPSRQQKKWIVDASWIDHVRKEHLVLTQQLALERQRVAALGQVEAENRWMEAMMLRALQQKKDFEQKLSQQKAGSWGQGRNS